MEVIKTFRHEYKYQINRDEMYKLRDTLSKILKIDRSIDGYMIRSLYFDSINDIDYYDKIDGNYERKKIRFRIYENNPNIVKLEIKRKIDYHQLKESLIINKEIAMEIINGKYDSLLRMNNPLAIELYNIMVSNCYRPKCIIEYKRIAFMSNEDTRITLDYDIKRSNDIENFFDGFINYYELINKYEVLLEVKYNKFIESYISKVLSKYITNNSSISKYIMGRNRY